MLIKLTLTGIALALTFITSAHFFADGHNLEVFALFLALTSSVYGGAALTPAGAKFASIELPFVIIVFITSIMGLVFSPIWLAIGYFAHGAWDLLHHYHKIKTPVVKWFPPLCAIFDALIGGFILIWWWQIS